jgi:hypothetical protein
MKKSQGNADATGALGGVAVQTLLGQHVPYAMRDALHTTTALCELNVCELK